MDKCVGCVSFGEVAPYEGHRCARSGSEQDGTGDVFRSEVAVDPRCEENFQEEPCHDEHGEWFYEPVDDESEGESTWSLADVDDAGEIDSDHHRVNHEPDEDAYWD